MLNFRAKIRINLPIKTKITIFEGYKQTKFSIRFMKDIIQTLNLLQQTAKELEGVKVAAIERDIALDKLRALYEMLLGLEAGVAEEPLPESVIELVEELIEEVEEFADSDEEPATEEVAEENTPTEEPAQEEPVAEPTVEEPKAEPIVEEPKATEEPKAVKGKLAHAAILSLYDDEEEEGEEIAEPEPQNEVVEPTAVQEVAEPEVEEKPVEEEFVIDMTEPVEEEKEKTIEEIVEEVVEEPAADEAAEEPVAEPEQPDVVPAEESAKVVLGEVLGAEQTTLADRMATTPPVDVASVAGASKSLTKMIGLNDKFILLRDLFQNNHDFYEAAIDQLDEFEELDEAMLFIHDNLHYSPSSEGAKVLADLLAKKFL